MPRKFPHLVRVVRHEGSDSEFERIADVLFALDGVRMDAQPGGHAEALDQLHFPGGGEIEIAAFLDNGLHHRGVRHGLERVVQIDTREGLAQLPELHAHPLAVEHEQRRAELPDQASDLCGLKGID